MVEKPLKKLKYQVVEEKRDNEAKVSELINPVLDKKTTFPGVMFDVRSNEDISAIKSYYLNRFPSKHICGFVMPFDRLRNFSLQLNSTVPQNSLFLCDIKSEVFWYKVINPKIRNFFSQFNALPQHVRNQIKSVGNNDGWGSKIDAHKESWEKIVNDQKILMSLVRAYINPQMSFNIDVASSISPLLLDKDHIDFVEACYDTSKKLYHSNILDAESERGKIIGLYLNIHKRFLRKKTNVTELFRMIGRSEPKAIIFKVCDMNDIRQESNKLVENYCSLIKGIAFASDRYDIPTFQLSVSTEGLISNARGIDAFSQPFNKKDNIEKAFGAKKETMKKLWMDNPQLTSGSAYDYHSKDIMKRPDFEKGCFDKNVLRSPIEGISKMRLDGIQPMTAKRFRLYSKILLMESRNFEEHELIDAIEKKQTRMFRNKFNKWLNGLVLFPK